MDKRLYTPILCLDFDGVLHSYTSGWQGAHIIPDPPVPGAMEFIAQAQQERFKVVVYSSRSHQPGGIQAMRKWILKHMHEAFTDEALDIVQDIDFPTEKPPAHLTIDDRAMTFEGWWPDPRTLRGFKPWNKRETQE